MKNYIAASKTPVVFNCLLILALLFGSFGLQVTPVYAQGTTTPVQINGQFNPDTIYPSQTSRLTINVFNPNTSALSEVNWTDYLPGDLVVVNPANPLISGCGGGYTLTAVPGTNTISIIHATTDGTTNPVSPGTCSVTVSVTSFTVGNHTNKINHATDGSVTIGGTVTQYEYDANITLLVLPMSSPTISKSFNQSSINEGEHSQLTLSIRNNDSNVVLTEVSLKDYLPTGMTVYDAPGSLSNCGSGTIQGSIEAEGPGQTWHTLTAGDTSLQLTGATIAKNTTCTIHVNVATDSTGRFTNTIRPGDLTNDQKITISSNVTANLIVENVNIRKLFTPNSIQSGGTSTLTITISNPDLVDNLTNVHFTDTLPTGLTVVSDSGGVSGTDCIGIPDTGIPGQITLINGTVPAGGSCNFTATVMSSVVDTYGNTLQCVPSEFGFNKSGDPVTAGCSDASDDLTVYTTGEGVSATKSFSPADVAPGTSTRMTISVIAPADTAMNTFSLTDNLPANVRVYSTPSATMNNCGSGTWEGSMNPLGPWHVLTVNDTSVRYSGGTIPAGGTCTLRVNVTSNEYGPHINTVAPADVTSTSPTGPRTIPGSITGTFTVRDISVNKSYASSIVGRNGKTILTIRLTNNYSIPLTGLTFSDILGGTVSDGIIIATPANLSNTCNGTVTAVSGTQTISLTGGSIPGPANTNCSISVDVQGTSSAPTPPGTTYTNTIDIGDVTGFVNGITATKNWHATSAGLTVGSPDFRINKKFDPILVTGDTASTMTITLVNTESSPISGITFTDTLPDHMMLANPASPNVGTCNGSITPASDRKSFLFSGGNLPANGLCKLTIKAIMDVTGNLINKIAENSVTTTQGATNLQPTSATLTNLSSVSVTKKFNPNPVSPGSVSLLTLTIKKEGIGIGLTGLGVVDTLTGGLTIASTPASTTTCGGVLSAPADGTQIQLTGGVMPIGTGTCTIVVPIKAPETGLKSDGYQNCIPAGTIITDQGYTNIMETCDTLDTIFDPPTGYKVLNSALLPELEWKMVWINDSNSDGINVQIRDQIPTGTTYVPASISCQARGSSSTTTCTYDAVNKEIFWEGNIGPDRNALDEASAINEVVIIFRVNVPDGLNLVNNQATSTTDTNGDEDFTDENSTTSVSVSNIATWERYSRRSGSDDGAASLLPQSGFTPNIQTFLPEKPEGIYKFYSDLRIEIPSLNITTDIVGLSLRNKKWDVTWLGNNLGYLEETAFPTWNGNSVITGHVFDANGKPGPLSNLKQMRYGEPVIIESYGQKFIYEVREVLTVAPNDIKAALKHQEQPWITLMTCQGYDEETKSYSSRVLVRAVLLKVE